MALEIAYDREGDEIITDMEYYNEWYAKKNWMVDQETPRNRWYNLKYRW
jgi:hypothetical protein